MEKVRVFYVIHKKLVIFSIFCFFFLGLLISLLHFSKCFNNTRLNYVIDVPIEAFNDNGILTDKTWIKFLHKEQPVGVIFFSKHLNNKDKAKNIIKSVKEVINNDVLLAADEEGGRVNRIGWINIMSAEEISENYVKIKNKRGVKFAKKYVENEYAKMFKEMKDIGLNMTFAPDVDINIYGDLDRKWKEYKFYKKTEEYMAIIRKNIDNLDKLERKKYDTAWLFYAYLDEIGVRNLDRIHILPNENEDFVVNLRNKWKKLPKQHKKILLNEFKYMSKYANYCSVIGDRSYGKDTKLIAELAKIFIHTAKKYDIQCVLKHALGHGRTTGDTHNGPESVDTSVEQILQDLYPYKQLIDEVKFVMPSYIIYTKIDDQNTAISSKKVLDFFRKNIGETVFIGDDMYMAGNQGERQLCDIHIKTHNKTVEDIMNNVNKEDYIHKNVYKNWFN